MEISQEILDKTHKGNSKLNIWLVIFFSVLTLFLYIIFPILIFLGIIFSILIFFRVWGKQKLPWYLFCFSSWVLIPTLSFIIGLFSYFTGNATIKIGNFNNEDHLNLDRETRFWQKRSSCLVMGGEIFTDYPYDSTIKLMYGLFGSQFGVYKGYYPDKFETKKILESNGQEINFTLKESNFHFILDKKDYLLKDNFARIKQTLYECQTAKATIINDELIIFKPLVLPEKTKYVLTYLADTKTGVIFARYYEKE